MPNEYWDFSKSGKENAETYLKMCAANNRKPKFSMLLDKNADGSYSLKEDGSTDGYWKLLIDFKMYDNDGVGMPQQPVKPIFNMGESERMLREYTGGHNAFPVANDVVSEFVSEYKAKNGDGNTVWAKYSLREFSDGTKFVDVQTDQSEFDSLPIEKMQAKAREIIKRKFVGKVIGTTNKAFVNGRTASEYAYPARFISDNRTKEAKLRASSELDNLLDAGRNFRTKSDGDSGHFHENASGGFSYFDVTFKVGDEYYSGVINIVNTERGRLLKDVTKIRNITEDISSSYGNNPKSTFLSDVSNNSIRSSSENSNTKIKKSEREITQERGKRRAEIYSELQRLKDERSRLLEQDADYAAAQEKRRYAQTFAERVEATRAINAAKAKIDTAELDERIQALQDERSAIDEAERAEYNAEKEKYSGAKTRGYAELPDTRTAELDEKYNDAVKRGNKKETQALVLEAAERAMPASVVRDEGCLLYTSDAADEL